MGSKPKAITRREGFWRDDSTSKLPMPVARTKPWRGLRRFLEALAKAERRAHANHCKGSSWCRLCTEDRNGSVTYELDGWEWPSGFEHYVLEHNVRPSLAFQEFILGYHLDDE